jgi:hypothetical protein
MQTYCKYTSLSLVSESITTGLGIRGKDYIVVNEHPLFAKPLSIVLDAASSKPISSMSNKQRYLLFVVLATKTKLFHIKHPISMAELPDAKVVSLLPLLIGACSRILLNKKEWDNLTNPCILPSMVFRSDTARNFAWDYLIKQCIAKSTQFLQWSDPVKRVQTLLTKEDSTDSELESEHILHHTLQGTIAKGKAIQFNLNHVRTVLALHEKELKEHGKLPMSPKTKDAILKLFVTDLDRIHIPIQEIINIKRAFTQYLDQAIEATNIVYREAYGMTIKKIDEIIIQLESKSRLFDDVPSVKDKKNIMAAVKPQNIQYTVDNGAVLESAESNSALQIELEEIELKLSKGMIPSLKKLLVMRKDAILKQIAMQEF